MTAGPSIARTCFVERQPNLTGGAWIDLKSTTFASWAQRMV